VKRIIYGGIIAVVFAGLVLVILLQRLNRITPVEVLEAVPGDAILFFEDVDYSYLAGTFFAENRIWVDFVNTTGRMRLDSLVSVLFAGIESNDQLRELLHSEGINLSIHLMGKDQLVPLFYIRYAEEHSDGEFAQIIFSLPGEESIVNDRKYEAETLYDVSSQPGTIPGKFTFCCLKGICLLSPSSLLVEEAVRTLHAEKDLAGEAELELVRSTAGRYVHANIFVNYSKLNQLFYPFVRQEARGKLDFLTGLATWGELDLDLKEESVILNGMTRAGGEEALFLGAISGQSPVRIDVHEFMPSGINGFIHYGISNKEKFREQMTTLFVGNETWDDIESEMDRIEQAYGIRPLDDLLNLLDDEIAWFSMEGVTEGPGEEIMIMETRSRSETREVMLNWINRYLEVNAFDMRSLLHIYRLDDQTSFEIYRLPEHFFTGTVPGRLFNSYFTLLENHLIFGPSVEVLSRVIYQNVLHKTFSNDPVFKEMSGYLSNRSNITLFIRPYPYLEYRKNILDEQALEALESSELFLRRIPGIVMQYSSETGLFYQNISLKYTSQIKEKALTVWESLLDSVAVLKPALVVNHNTSDKEIFVQDATGKIYLINSTGRILWSRQLEEEIMGEVYQIDFYKNGKLQYLFNTREKLHLIDRNGNYVERYPVTLRSPATNPLALFDYDNNKNYRLFIAGEDREIYVYKVEGNTVPGWRFGRTEGTVTRVIQHFRIGNLDYIVAADEKRTYFLDRRGRERIRTGEQVVVSPNNLLILDMNIREERPRWISTDTAGNVIAIYQDGAVSRLYHREVTPDHYFRMQDMDMDGIPEYFFADGAELTVLKQGGERIFNFRVREKISSPPDIYKFSASDIKIGLTDQPRNRIYLVNPDGSLYDGFPLEGSTRFSIGTFANSESRFNLIVGSANNFLYNYSIE